MKIIYLGNKLSQYGFTPTSVEALGIRLEDHFDMIRGSEVRNPIGRLLHMMWLVIRYRKSDVLLIDTYSTWAFWYAVLISHLASFLGLSYTPILHGGNLPSRAKKSPYFTRMLLRNAKSVVCPSGYLLYEMNAFYERDYMLIPNYIDIANYPFRVRAVSNPIRLLWVRSFHKIYNPSLAVDIVKGLDEKGYEVQLTMVGPDKDGSLQETKDYAVDLGVAKYIEFKGRLSKPEWIQLADQFDVFINTTNVDNTPVSVMEAMALGMIVISTNVGGMPFLYVNEREGILVPPKDSVYFIEAIEKLLEDSNLAKGLSQNARLKAENWDWNEVEKQWFKLLNR